MFKGLSHAKTVSDFRIEIYPVFFSCVQCGGAAQLILESGAILESSRLLWRVHQSHADESREVMIRDPLGVGFLGSGPNSRYSEYLISDSPFRGLSIHLYGR